MKTLTFELTIAASPARVWDAMLQPESYKAWTAAFCEGSSYAGSWDEGATIRFLTPSGDGMVSQIAVNRPGEFLKIRHLGEVRQGVDDTASDAVRAWAPAFEIYRLTDETGGSTLVRASIDAMPEYEAFMNETFPKALQRLKVLCERAAA